MKKLNLIQRIATGSALVSATLFGGCLHNNTKDNHVSADYRASAEYLETISNTIERADSYSYKITLWDLSGIEKIEMYDEKDNLLTSPKSLFELSKSPSIITWENVPWDEKIPFSESYITKIEATVKKEVRRIVVTDKSGEKRKFDIEMKNHPGGGWSIYSKIDHE